MPGVRHRFGAARGVKTSSFRPRGGLSGGFGVQPARFTGGTFRQPIPRFLPTRPKAKMPRLGVPRIHVAPGITIHPRLQFVYFDRSIIRSNWNAINRTPLQRSANLVRLIARRSIKRRKSRLVHSKPGSPPYSHYPGKTPPFKQIFNFPINFGSGQIIGMVGTGSSPAVPGLHEHGGRAARWIRNRGRGKQPRNIRGQFAHFNQPRFLHRVVRYPKRPFMMPALAKVKSQIPKFWINSFNRKAVVGRSNMGR